MAWATPRYSCRFRSSLFSSHSFSSSCTKLCPSVSAHGRLREGEARATRRRLAGVFSEFMAWLYGRTIGTHAAWVGFALSCSQCSQRSSFSSSSLPCRTTVVGTRIRSLSASREGSTRDHRILSRVCCFGHQTSAASWFCRLHSCCILSVFGDGAVRFVFSHCRRELEFAHSVLAVLVMSCVGKETFQFARGGDLASFPLELAKCQISSVLRHKGKFKTSPPFDCEVQRAPSYFFVRRGRAARAAELRRLACCSQVTGTGGVESGS